MLKFGLRFFKDVYAVQNLISLEQVFEEVQKQWNAEQPNFPEDLTKFSEQFLLDAIKVSICFENYLKGKLINIGYLVHQIDSKASNGSFKKLGSIDSDPIKFSSYLGVEGYSVDSTTNTHVLRGIKLETVRFSTLLENGKYLKLLQIPEKVLSILKKNNLTRNKLHLPLPGSGFSKVDIAHIRELCVFVNDNIIPKYNELLAELFAEADPEWIKRQTEVPIPV